MSEQDEEDQAEHTNLQCASVQDQCGPCGVPNSLHPRPVGENVSEPEAQRRSQPKVVKFQYQLVCDHSLEG